MITQFTPEIPELRDRPSFEGELRIGLCDGESHVLVQIFQFAGSCTQHIDFTGLCDHQACSAPLGKPPLDLPVPVAEFIFSQAFAIEKDPQQIIEVRSLHDDRMKRWNQGGIIRVEE